MFLAKFVSKFVVVVCKQETTTFVTEGSPVNRKQFPWDKSVRACSIKKVEVPLQLGRVKVALQAGQEISVPLQNARDKGGIHAMVMKLTIVLR